ncbi:MAG: signal peptidase I [Bacilli bacterium]
MGTSEIISIVVTFIGVASFATVFTILYSNYTKSQSNEIKTGKHDIAIIDEVIYEGKEKIKNRKKKIKIIKNIFFTISMIIIIPLFLFSIYNKVTNSNIIIGNHSLMAVASGSMSEKHQDNDYLLTNDLNNQFLKYDIIILEKVEPEELKLYDVIAYTNDNGVNIIHRIVKVNDDGTFVTKGDASGTGKEDSYHPTYADVIGRYTGKKINGLGIIVAFFQSYAGIITIVSLVYCLFIIDYMANKVNIIYDERLKKLAEAMDYSTEKNSENFKAEYVEKIYFKGYIYYFDENGFVKKEENLEHFNDENKVIKEIQNKENNEIVKEEINLTIEEEKKDEE